MKPHALVFVASASMMFAIANRAVCAAQLEPLQEVTVTAHRVELEKRASKFVNEIAAVQNENGLPRWHRPVCPSVSGLTQRDGEFMLARLSQVAQAVGVPLAGENCHANLYVLVYPRPKELLLAMEKRNWIYTFGQAAHPIEMDEFISTSGPVKVWYNSDNRTPEGLPVGRVLNVRENPSPLSRHVVAWVARVFVIIDQTRLRGVTRGQLADYVAMVALADIKPAAKLGDVPTILRLFEAAPQSATAGLTGWDQAFLKSLYATDQAATLQRTQIAHQMVRDIAP